MRRVKNIFNSFTQKERLVFYGAAAIFCLSGIFSVALAFGKATSLVPAEGGTYTAGIVGQPVHINPVFAQSPADKALVRMIFSPLTELADKIEPSQNGRGWKVRLKENLFWSDGERLTSDDVIFTVQKLQDPDSGSPYFSNWQGVVASRASQLEVQFNLAAPYALFLENIKELYPVPKHIFADVPAVNWRLSDFNLRPVGNGPYKFSAISKRSDGFIDLYELTINDRYTEAKPFIENFDIRFFTRKEDALSAFNSGQIDGLTDIAASELGVISRPYSNVEFKLPTYYAVFINQSANLPLQDISIRKALYLATDRAALISGALSGSGEEVWGPLPPTIPFLPSVGPPNSTSSPTDILEADGWHIATSGAREKTVKNLTIKLSLELTVPKVAFLEKTADILKDQWQKAGFDVQISPAEVGDELSQIVKNRKYQAIIFGYIINPSGDLYSFWHSSERFYPGLNLSLYGNKTTDQLIENIRQETDVDKRNSELLDLQGAVINDYPAVFLYSPSYIYVTDNDLRGAENSFIADPADIFGGAKNWYLKTARVFK